MKKCLVLLTLAAALIGFSGAQVSAASEPHKVITVSPSTSKPVIEPGQTIKDKFQVINQGKTAFDVKIYASPYGVQGEDYAPDFESVPGKPDVASWLHFDKEQASVNKDKTVDVGYSITVPKNTEPGGYYAVAFVESKTEKGHGVVVNERVGEVFYIQVAGTIRKSGKISSWKAPFWQVNPVKADLRLENSGGVHYSSDTHIYVQDLFGGTKYGQISDKVILPQTVRHIPFKWDKAPSFGLFKITGTVNLPNGEVKLPTRYVLVMTKPLRIFFGIVIVVLVAFAVFKFTMTKMRPKRTSAPKKNKRI